MSRQNGRVDAPQPQPLPERFRLPDLPPALDAWFAFAGSLGDDVEMIHDGEIVDDLRVVDRESARLALAGYRFVIEKGQWCDAAATGDWRESWIVIESVNADPVIADISTPGVAILTARHGEGRWNPKRVFDTLTGFIDGLIVNENVPPHPPLDPAVPPALSVWATTLGPEPLKTLIQLRNRPTFDTLTRPRMLEIRNHLPALLADHLTLRQAESCVEYGARFGATFEIRPSTSAASRPS